MSSSWLLLVVGVGLTGCAGEPPPSEDSVGTRSEVESRQEVAPEPVVPEPAEPCSAETERAIQEIILSQSRSFTERDWEAAHSYSSRGFQSSVSLDVFERLISRNYEMLLYFEEAFFGACEMSDEGTNASIFVEIRSTYQGPVMMEYDLVAEEQTWKIFAVSNPVSAVPNV